VPFQLLPWHPHTQWRASSSISSGEKIDALGWRPGARAVLRILLAEFCQVTPHKKRGTE